MPRAAGHVAARGPRGRQQQQRPGRRRRRRQEEACWCWCWGRPPPCEAPKVSPPAWPSHCPAQWPGPGSLAQVSSARLRAQQPGGTVPRFMGMGRRVQPLSSLSCSWLAARLRRAGPPRSSLKRADVTTAGRSMHNLMIVDAAQHHGWGLICFSGQAGSLLGAGRLAWLGHLNNLSWPAWPGSGTLFGGGCNVAG